MRVLVTGAHGKVGTAVVTALRRSNHDVTTSDLHPPTWDREPEGTPPYVCADLTEAGEAYALVGGISAGENGKAGPYDAVVHCAALPAPGRHAPDVVFRNNLMSVFNVVEACVRWRVARLVNISSETAPGFAFAERAFYPEYLPVDELHPLAPQDPYGQGLRRAALRCGHPPFGPAGDQSATHLGPGCGHVRTRMEEALTLADEDRLAVNSAEQPRHVVPTELAKAFVQDGALRRRPASRLVETRAAIADAGKSPLRGARALSAGRPPDSGTLSLWRTSHGALGSRAIGGRASDEHLGQTCMADRIRSVC